MNKKLIIIISVVLGIAVIGGGIYLAVKKDNVAPVTEESLAFEDEYEGLNDQDNGSGGRHKVVSLPSNAPVKYTSYDEIFEILDSGSGVIYFGFPECPWCRNIIEPLVASALDYGLDTIYYFNNREDRNTLTLNRGEVTEEFKGTDEYNKLIEILDEHLPEYGGLNDKSIKRLYFPTFVFVKDGEVIGLEQSLEAYSSRVQGDPSIEMLDTEVKELEDLFKSYYKKIEG